MVTPETLKLMALLVEDGLVDDHVVDGGLVDEHVVVVLVDDHEVQLLVLLARDVEKKDRSFFSFPVCVLLAWFIVADRQESLEVSELWSLVAVNAGWRTLVAVNAGCCERWLL
jgi:hypothetical protein